MHEGDRRIAEYFDGYGNSYVDILPRWEGRSQPPINSLLGANMVAASGILQIDALLLGIEWAGDVVTFAFPVVSSTYNSDYSPGDAADGFIGVSFTVGQTVRSILQGFSPLGSVFAYGSVASLTNLSFLETGPDEADIRIGSTTTDIFPEIEDPVPAWAKGPGFGQGGDVWLNHDYVSAHLPPQPGNYVWATLLHELGHALGLRHAHLGTSQYNPGFEGVGPLPSEVDSLEFTVMTYRSYVGDDAAGYDNETWGYPQTFMMYDIAALQYLYGADFTTNSTATVYTWSVTTGEMFLNGVGQGSPGANRIFLTIWDGGGVDTYDFGDYSLGLEISLVPGGYCRLDPAQLANLGNNNFARGNVFNSLLYQGDLRSMIENATGGSGGDTIFGNEVANELRGGGGDDTLHGGVGVDSLYGGDNFDVLYGGGDGDFLAGEGGDDELIGGDGGDTYSVGLGQGYDIIFDNAASVGDVLALYTGGYTTLDLRWFTAVGDDLLIRIPQAGGAYALHLLVQGMGSSTGQIETLEFRPGEGSVAIATLNLVQDIWNKVANPGPVLFSDAFNRTDGEPANGWSQLTDNAGGGALLIEDGRLTTNGSPAMMGVYRPLDLEGPVTIAATLTHCSGYGGIPYRYVTQFLFGSDGTTTSGFGLQIYRGDINYANSSIILIHNGVNLAESFSTFQFEEAIDVQFTLHDDLSISGVVTDGLNSFSFYFDPVDIQLTGSNLAVIATDAGTGINSTIDNLVISEGTANVSLVGADVSETLAGRYGDDVVSGAGGDDTLIGGAGNDQLLGGNGADTFRFEAGLFGNDTVTDFANGVDLIQLTGIAGVDDFSDLVVSANGGNALITLPDGSTITLNGVSDGLVDASDFVFGG